MHDKALDRLVPYVAVAVIPLELITDESTYYTELERLGQEFDNTCESPETKEVVTHIIEIIRDLAWALDEATGTPDNSKWLIEHGRYRTWSLDD